MMSFKKVISASIAILHVGILLPFSAQAAEITSLFNTALEEFPGQEGLMLTVEYAPGEKSAQHRHDANVFVYVLEGTVVMQVEGEDAVTLTKGETFYESRQDVHSVSANASESESAKILVFMLKQQGLPASVPAP